MSDASRSRIIRCAAIVEEIYAGESDGSMQPIDAAVDGFFLFSTGDPITVELEQIDNTPLRGSFTKGKKTPSYRTYKWGGTVYANSHDSNINPATGGGDPYDSGEYPGLALRAADRSWGPLWRACGLGADYTVDNKVTFKPTSTVSAQRSCRIVTELDGIYFDLMGGRGTFVINGSAGQPLEIAYDIMGKPATGAAGAILDPTSNVGDLESVTWAAWDGGSSDNPLFQCANGTIIVAGGSTLGPADFVLKSFSFDRGASVEARRDANDCESVREYFIGDASPTLELVIDCQQDVANWIEASDAFNPWKNHRQSTLHGVSFSHGIVSGATAYQGLEANQRFDFNFPQAQLTNVQTGEGDAGIRTVTLSYELTHTTDDEEFSILWGGDTSVV